MSFDFARPLPLADDFGVRTGHTRAVTAIAGDAEARVFVSASADGTVKLWDPDTGVCLQTIVASQSAIVALALVADGRALALLTADGTARVLSLPDCAPISLRSPRMSVFRAVAVAFPDDGPVALLRPYVGRGYRIGPLGADTTLTKCADDRMSFQAAAGLPRGAGMRFASGEPDGAVHIADTAWEGLTSFRDHHGSVTALATSRNGAWLASGAADGRVVLRRLGRGEVTAVFNVSVQVSIVAIDEAGRWIAAVTAQGIAVHDAWENATRHHGQPDVTACAVAARPVVTYRDTVPGKAFVAVGDVKGEVSIGTLR